MCCCGYSDSEWTGRPAAAGCGALSPDAALLEMHVCCWCLRVNATGVGASALPAANCTPRYPTTDLPARLSRDKPRAQSKPVDGSGMHCCRQGASKLDHAHSGRSAVAVRIRPCTQRPDDSYPLPQLQLSCGDAQQQIQQGEFSPSIWACKPGAAEMLFNSID